MAAVKVSYVKNYKDGSKLDTYRVVLETEVEEFIKGLEAGSSIADPATEIKVTPYSPPSNDATPPHGSDPYLGYKPFDQAHPFD